MYLKQMISREIFIDLINNNESWAIWRLPDETDQHSIGANHLVRGINRGFVISPFLPELFDEYTFTIPLERYGEHNETDDYCLSNELPEPFPFPKTSTTAQQHAAAITKIKQKLDEIAINTPHSKVVSATVKLIEKKIDLYKLFQNLCRKYPSAFIFLVNTPVSGVMFGATPELLIKCKDDNCTTMALAGTRPVHSKIDWDNKNIEEQAIVRNYILDELQQNGYICQVGDLHTRAAGPVEHICNVIDFHAIDSEQISEPADIYDQTSFILRQLSPTPALAGYPKDLSIQTIKETEHFRRGYYGGFLGPVNSPADYKMFVNLRSGRISGKGEDNLTQTIALYAGGGITCHSEIQLEQTEVSNKLSTLASIIESTPTPELQ